MTTPLNAITSFDAALILRHIVQLPPPLTADQLTVANVTSSAQLTSFDASRVVNYVVNNGNPTGSTGTIVPPGLLMGDVSGAGPHYDGSPGTPAASLPTMNAGGVVVVPVSVGDLTGLGVISYDFQVTFDPTVLQAGSPAYDRTGTLGGQAWSITTNANNPGHLIISGYSIGNPLTGSGTLLNLRFNVLGTPGQSTALTFVDYTDPGSRAHQSFLFNEGTPSVGTVTNGSVTLVPFTPTPTSTPTNTATATNTATPSSTATSTATGTPTPPSLGIYPNTTVALSSNATIVPNAAPINTTRITAETTTGFVGELTADPVTGVVRVTNAHHANVTTGNYTVAVKAFGINGLTTTRTFTLTVTNGTACSQDVHFNPPAMPEIGAGSSAYAVAIGDFNNDGIQDIVTAHQSGNASIRLGDGSGGFISTVVPDVPVGSQPYSVAVGDFNGDGNQDFAVANAFSNNVSIRLGNGNGGFTSPATPEIAVGTNPVWVSVGDLNGDGIADLAVANYVSSSVSIRLGNGTGGFTSPPVPEIAVLSSPYSVAIGDFNGDGILDLATANYSAPGTVSIRLGNGSGGFVSPVVPEVTVGSNPYSVAIGDLNNDGLQDLATANLGSDNISIRLGNGNGGFTSPAIPEIPVLHEPSSIAIGDFNNDGIQDFASSYINLHTVSIRLGDGSGGFMPPTTPEVGVGFHAQAVAIGDFNADGRQDLVTANRGLSISIRLGICGAPTPTGTATPTNTATATPTVNPLAVTVSLPAFSGTPGIVLIPITVGDLTGKTVLSYDLHVHHDSTVLAPASPPYDTAGTLSSGMVVNIANAPEPGHLVIGAFSGTPRVGSGTLLYLRFNITGTVGQYTYLNFENYTDPSNVFHPKFIFNEGNPPAVTTDGSVTVAATPTPTSTSTSTPTATATASPTGTPNPGTIAGNVNYGNAVGAPSVRYIPNVMISGAGSAPVSALTNASGNYLLSGFWVDSYTVTPTKTGGINGSITSFDAAKIAQYVAGNITLSPNQIFVANVSGDLNITSFDAAQIARYITAIPPYGFAGTWRFGPSSRTYFSIQGNLTSENYSAYLMGDVSGNWNNTGSRPGLGRRLAADNEPERGVSVALPNLSASSDSNKEVVVPVTISGVANKEIISYEFTLRYDPLVLQPQSAPVELVRTVSRGFSFAVNATEPGLLKVVVYGAMPIDEIGTLLNLKFTAVGKPGSVSPISFERIMFNEGEAKVSASEGLVRLY